MKNKMNLHPWQEVLQRYVYFLDILKSPDSITLEDFSAGILQLLRTTHF